VAPALTPIHALDAAPTGQSESAGLLRASVGGDRGTPAGLWNRRRRATIGRSAGDDHQPEPEINI